MQYEDQLSARAPSIEDPWVHTRTAGVLRQVACVRQLPINMRFGQADTHSVTSWETLKLKLGACGLATTATANGFPPFVRRMSAPLKSTPSTSEAHLRCSSLHNAAASRHQGSRAFLCTVMVVNLSCA